MKDNYTIDEFISFANRECQIIGEKTGKYYYIKQIGDKEENKFNIWYGNCHILQSTNLSYLLGYLHGMRDAYENINV